MFASCFDDGYVYEYSIDQPVSADSQVSKKSSSKGYPKPRNLVYWPSRDELYVGYAGGKLCVFKAGEIGNGPICRFWLDFRLDQGARARHHGDAAD
jgi:hypothetical protein